MTKWTDPGWYERGGNVRSSRQSECKAPLSQTPPWVPYAIAALPRALPRRPLRDRLRIAWRVLRNR